MKQNTCRIIKTYYLKILVYLSFGESFGCGGFLCCSPPTPPPRRYTRTLTVAKEDLGAVSDFCDL